MTIKNKRKKQRKYFNSIQGQAELYRNWKIEQEKLTLSEIIKQIRNEYK